MLSRVLSSLIGLALLIFVLFLGKVAFGLGICFLAVVGIYEFYSAVEVAGYRPIKFIGYLYCLVPISISLIPIDGSSKGLIYITMGIFLTFAILFSFIIFNGGKYNLIDISLTIFGIIYVVFLFMFIVLTRDLDKGLVYLWMIFIGAWATDIAAYFTGICIGKTKIMPSLSPKKTLEGSIGGIIGAVGTMFLYGLLLNNYGIISGISIYQFVLIGILCGVISQIGDFAASSLKRFAGIKDFGKIMPGHGGVLDRFDSILFIGPVVYFYVNFFILN